MLKSRGVEKGDRVCIYMPMIPEAAYAMLACARIGAVHSVVFGGFSPDSLRDRILDADCRTMITADEGVRGGKYIPLKQNVEKALKDCPDVSTVVVVERTQGDIPWVEGRDIWYHEALHAASADCPAEAMDAEDPLFILYTSGSTGKPKGVLHTTGGYLLGAAMTHKYVFDYHDGDVYWCTADVGWVTGHSYIVYGPLANGATTLMFEGVPNYPDASRFWQVIDKHQVNIFYTAPTAIRALMREGDAPVRQTSRSSLRLLGSVGEPINPEAWEWYYQVVGEALPHRRYLVADRDRQHLDHPVARRHCAKARLGYPPVLRRATRAARRERQGNRRRGQRRTGDQGQLAESDPQRLRRPPADDRHLLQALPRVLLQRRRRAPRRGRLLLDHRPGRRRDQCLRTPDRHRRGRARWSCTMRWPRRQWSAARMT